jgi:hypothetical protein
VEKSVSGGEERKRRREGEEGIYTSEEEGRTRLGDFAAIASARGAENNTALHLRPSTTTSSASCEALAVDGKVHLAVPSMVTVHLAVPSMVTVHLAVPSMVMVHLAVPPRVTVRARANHHRDIEKGCVMFRGQGDGF